MLPDGLALAVCAPQHLELVSNDKDLKLQCCRAFGLVRRAPMILTKSYCAFEARGNRTND